MHAMQRPAPACLLPPSTTSRLCHAAVLQQQSSCSDGARRQRQRRRGTALAVAGAAAAGGALIIEADGALADLHMDGHRVGFCRAFHELGMDCANWTPAIYHDLLSKGDGTGPGLVRAYYSCVGWPTFLPTGEHEVFANKVYELKQQQLRKLLAAGGVPLRDGVTQVLEQALAAGFKIALVAETCSDPSDDVMTSLLQQLPPHVAAGARVYATSMCRQPLAEEGDADAEPSAAAAGASLAAAAARMKQKGAREFVAQLSAALEGKEAAVGVQIGPGLQAPGPSASASTALLAAVAAILDVPVSRCIAVASSSDIINAAAAAGMVPVALPRKMAYAASYPAAAAKFECWGPGAATFNRLLTLLPGDAEQQQQRQQ